MAFPTVQARTVWQGAASNSTSHSVTMPGSISAGDLLICVFSVDGSPTCTASGTWTKLGQASNTTVVTGAVFWKIAEGSDTLTVTTSATEQASAITYRITGGYYVAGTSANGSSTNSNPPSQAVTDGTQDYLWIVTRSGDSTVNATVAPTGYSNLTTQNAAGTGGASTAVADRTLNTGSSQDPGTFTSASEQWVSWTLCVSPVETVVTVSPSSATIGTVESTEITATVTRNSVAQSGLVVTAASSDATKATVDVLTATNGPSSHTGYTLRSMTGATESYTAPSGTTVRKFTETTANDEHTFEINSVAISGSAGDIIEFGGEYKSTRSHLRFNFYFTNNTSSNTEFIELATGTTSTPGGSTIDWQWKDLGGGWYRLKARLTANAAFNVVNLAVTAATSGSVYQYTGSTSDSVEVGAQWYAVRNSTDSSGQTKLRVWGVAAGTSNVTATSIFKTSSASAITVSTGLSGSLSKTLDAATLSSAGEISIAGTLSATLGAATSAATGAVDLVGTLSSTLAAATAASTGTLAVEGSLSSTLGAATLSAAGTLVEAGIEGELASTLADASVSSAGALAIEGQAAATLAAATTAATGVVAIRGQAASTLANAALAGTGALEIAGAAATTLADATSSATGALAITGSLSGGLGAAALPSIGLLLGAGGALAPATLEASGAVGNVPITGSLSATLAAASLDADGALAIEGTAAATLAAATAAATGALAIDGAVASTLDAATVVATGEIAIDGALASTLASAALSASATLADGPSGSLAATLADATASAAGSLALRGSVGATLADATVVASGTVDILGTVAPTLADATLSASGAIALRGAAAATLEDASLSASGQGGEFIAGEVSATLADATAAADGRLSIDAQVAATLATATIAAAARLYAGAGRRGGVGTQRQGVGRPADSVATRSAVQTITRSGGTVATRRNVQRVSRVN